jgi:hypothetical protein
MSSAGKKERRSKREKKERKRSERQRERERERTPFYTDAIGQQRSESDRTDIKNARSDSIVLVQRSMRRLESREKGRKKMTSAMTSNSQTAYIY